jgi:hypothetical protein
VIVDHIAQVSMYLIQKLGTHVVVSAKKNIGVENVKDNDNDINQFEQMPLFINPMSIKYIEKDFDKNFMPYTRKGGNEKSV